MLSSRSDNALASYLLAHALASVMLAFFLLPFLSSRKGRARFALMLLLTACSYAVPIAGFLGVVLAVFVLRLLRQAPATAAFGSIQLPEFDQHQRRQGSFRHAGLRAFLGNAQAPLQSRLRAMVALQHLPGKTSSPVLRTVLSDPSEDLRLLAYGMLDALEKRVNSSIDTELDALRAGGPGNASGLEDAARMESRQRLSDLYWELVYQDLVQGDLKTHAIKESLRYCDEVLCEQPNNAQLHLRRGRLMHQQNEPLEAARSYERARALGMPATRVLPYEAELSFERRDFARTRELMQELNNRSALHRLEPLVNFWTVQ